jgi:formylglycine-generating enzyme required for sulfatase activity
MKPRILFCWILLLFVYGASAQVDDARKDAGVCARCHVISVAEWGYSKHRKAGTDCIACHGASQGHVIDERNNVKPDEIPRRAAVARLCLSCHEDGCLKSKETGSCQKCHHVHALLDPRTPPAIRDERLEQLEVRWQRYSQLIKDGEQQVKAQQWEAARTAFQGALKEKPRDAAAATRLKMCERRMKPGMAGFEIIGTAFDDVTGLPCEVRIVGLGIPMQLVPGGECDLGSDHFANTKPAHQVRVEPFYLARHELTQDEWRAILGSNPSAHQGTNFPNSGRWPVEQVSWEDAQALVRALNDRVAVGGFRLPTEAEWEYTARAGGESGEAFELTEPRAVEQGTPNRLGLFDMAGNVREWCSSRLVPYPYSATDGREATSESGLRVLRGGAFIEPHEWYEPAARHGERPNRRLPSNGLRLARSIPGDVIVVLKPKNE